MSSTAAAHRVLVIGCDLEVPGIASYEWSDLPPFLNIADFTLVIIAVEDLTTTLINHLIGEKRWPNSEHFARLMFTPESRLVLVGSPRDDINLLNHLMRWLPILPSLRADCGQSIQEVEAFLEPYFEGVSKWSFHSIASQVGDRKQALAWAANAVGNSAGNMTFEAEFEAVAINLARLPIAFTINYELHKAPTHRDPIGQKMHETSPALWLPVSDAGFTDSAQVLVRLFTGIGATACPPDWLCNWQLPDQLVANEELHGAEAEASLATKRYQESVERQLVASRFQALLYEKGEDVLEPLVRDALAVLGATVSEPTQRGKADGSLVCPAGRSAVLEIKGRKNAIGLRDVRQLSQWVDDSEAENGLVSKGILIGNAFCEMPPDERPEAFPGNGVDFAKRRSMCLMTTLQLFEAVRSKQRDEFKESEFWDLLFQTSGPLPDVEAI